MTGPTTNDPSQTGPLDRPTANALLAKADALLAASDFGLAQAHYQRLIGFPDPAITGAAMLGAGEALFRLDDERQARWHWEQAAKLPENVTTYAAWRQVAAARVREGELKAAIEAYREAERRAPAADRGEISARLGWLSKELGDPKAAGRYFARSRQTDQPVFLSYAILAITVVVSVLAMQSEFGTSLDRALALWKERVAEGEWWRLVSVTLLHGGIGHLFFNMYFLFLVGPLVEQLFGPLRFLLFYVLTAATGAVASYLLGDVQAIGVGASGALFGLCGVLLAARFLYRPVLRGSQRAMYSQIGMLVVINLVLGFGLNVVGGNIDNLAHAGGLLGGLWLGALLPPIGAATMPIIGTRPGGGMPGSRTNAAPAGVVVGGRATGMTAVAVTALRWLGVLALVGLVALLVVLGAGRYT